MATRHLFQVFVMNLPQQLIRYAIIRHDSHNSDIMQPMFLRSDQYLSQLSSLFSVHQNLEV